MEDGKLTYMRTERRDAAKNRQRILDTALMLFEQHGVEQVSMNQIAIEAGIGPGTLYRRYRNKGELCLDLIKDNVVLLFEDIDMYFEQNQSEPPSLRLKGILSLFIRFRENKAQLLKGVEDSEVTNRKKSRSPLYDELNQIIVNLFNEINAEKESQKNSVFQADMLLTVLKSDSYLFQREIRGYTPEEILEQICEIFIS
ncbi:TetR/AcrR family transcriptional regulator [Terrilactibacillus laevilacticus]|uniref:TetR/AcrR family transcriptional regulator n=1 Tax=Terrilactibacillus laevilacticus TaxID=1380157 RepID=A0ABW5PL11_9BACI|nr:TetR/AcrR family transcriptional regulator [Terrilactibacillus laevilacticus]